MYDLLCPGCGHRIAMNIIDGAIEKLGIKNKVIFAHDVGCCSLLPDEAYYDGIMCPHGGVISVSVGIKNSNEDKFVLSYMGDGAAYTIGLNELIHGATRKDDLCVIVINNGIFAMTGGQKDTTSIDNQDFLYENVIKCFNPSFMARAALTDKENVDFAKECIEECFDSYVNNGGFNIVELLSPCPTNYKVSSTEYVDAINNLAKTRYKIFKESSRG